MLEGIIIRGIGGFYYVKTEEGYLNAGQGVYLEKKTLLL